MRKQSENGLVWYESEALNEIGVRHGFFNRRGGSSKPPFDSLNVKTDLGDEEEKVLENRQLILTSISAEKLVYSNDLPHKSDYLWVESEQQTDPAVDALATEQHGLAIGLGVADCLPVIISDGRIVAVIHAGWKGTLAGIVDKTVNDLVQNHEFNVEIAVAALGPCICTTHLEVEGEAAKNFREHSGQEVNGSKFNVDLVKLNSLQLANNGVKNIDNLGICALESEEFFSYRRDHGNTGRNMAIALLS